MFYEQKTFVNKNYEVIDAKGGHWDESGNLSFFGLFATHCFPNFTPTPWLATLLPYCLFCSV
jgi:hypothetical protein